MLQYGFAIQENKQHVGSSVNKLLTEEPWRLLPLINGKKKVNGKQRNDLFSIKVFLRVTNQNHKLPLKAGGLKKSQH